ncbi:TPA: IS3 family transposase [Escherichia coli]|nr:IS3 family transposase [Escherichia coli]
MPLLDKLREQCGVGPVCSELHIAPSTYYHCQQQRHHPDKRSARAQRDDWLKKEIQRVYDENHKVYGVRKVWRQLLREGIRVARCTVARLMAVKRIMLREYDRLIITKGYPKRDDSSRRIDVPYGGYEIKTITHPHFGDKPVKVFAIKVNIGNK